MKVFLAVLLILSVILETTIIPFPLTLLLVMFADIFIEENVALLSFVAGLLLDLFSLRILGVSSLFFLLVCFVRQRYGQKISSGSLVFQLPFFIITMVVYNYLFFHLINIRYLAVVIIISSLVIFFIGRFIPVTSYKKRLKLE